MSNKKIEKENKPRKECKPLLTFQTHDLSYQIRSTMHGKIMKPNPQNIKCWRKRLDKIINLTKRFKIKIPMERMNVKIKIKNK